MERRLQIILAARDQASQVLRTVSKDIASMRSTLAGVQAAAVNAGAAIRNQFAFVGRAVGMLRGQLVAMAAQLGILAGVGAVLGAIRFSIMAAADVERQRAQLAALTGSYQEAGRIIGWVVEQAAKTPFEIPGLIEMVAQLKSVGLDFRQWFGVLGDLAVQGGRDLAEGLQMATLAVVRLRSGAAGEAFEQLRRLKISRRDLEMQGVRFSTGGELVSSVDQALSALQRVIQVKFGGSMERMQSTAAVAFSNVGDMVRNLALAFAGVTKEGDVQRGGLFQRVRDSTRAMLDWFERNWDKVAKQAQAFGARVAVGLQALLRHLPNAVGWLQRLYDALVQAKDAVAVTFTYLAGGRSLGEVLVGLAERVAGAVQTLARWWRENAAGIGRFLGLVLRMWVLAKVVAILVPVVTVLVSLYKALRSATIAVLAFLGVTGPHGWKDLAVKIALAAAAIAAGIGAFAMVDDAISDMADSLRDAAAAADELRAAKTGFQLEDLRNLNTTVQLEDRVKQAAAATRSAFEAQESALKGTSAELTNILALQRAQQEVFDAWAALWPQSLRPIREQRAALEAQLATLAKLRLEQQALYDLQVASGMAPAAQQTAVALAQTMAAYLKTARDLQQLTGELARVLTQPLERAAAAAGAEAAILTAAGRDPTAALRDQVGWLTRLQAALELAGRHVARYSELWWTLRDQWQQVRKELHGAWQEMLTANAERLVAISDSQRDAAAAVVAMLEKQQAPLGMINAARAQLIQLDMEHLANLADMEAAYERAGKVVDANKVRASIAQVRGEVYQLQAEMRKGMQDAWDDMAAKLINAPVSMQRVLARAGVTLWQRQLQAMQAWQSLPRMGLMLPNAQQPIDVRVLVELDGEPLRALVRAEQDSQLILYSNAGQ